MNDLSIPAPAGRPGGARAMGVWLGVLAAAFSVPLVQLAIYASGTDLHSHVVLIPLVTAYLLWTERARLPAPGPAFLPGFLVLALAGAAMLAFALLRRGAISWNDYLAAMAFAFVCLLAAGGFLLLGGAWMRAAAFPVAFLVFLVPMPEAMEHALENASTLASAEVSAWLFQLAGVPNLRSGVIFELPGITIKVAQECSGIRSSWVLFITSLLAAHLFLRTNWRRAALVAFVIPLGIVRNAFRILVIGMLCVEVGPHMIDSIVHKRGGPAFFLLSLVPLALFAWLLRRSEARSLSGGTTTKSGKDCPK